MPCFTLGNHVIFVFKANFINHFLLLGRLYSPLHNNRMASRMPKSQLTRWFISLVKDSRRYQNSNGKVRIGPHRCRKFAASYSVLLDQDMDRVLNVLGFSSPNFFLQKTMLNMFPH